MSDQNGENGTCQKFGTWKQSYSFEAVVALSGYRNVVSTNSPPKIYIHDGPTDGAVVVNGMAEYLISENGLSDDESEKSRQILERLVALGDWAAVEIVERRHRDDERALSGYHQIKPRLTVPQMLILRFVRQNPGSALVAISAATGMASVEVGLAIDHLLENGILERLADGGKLTLSAAELRRYQNALTELKGGV
ncbi:hypothetical protein [Ensifer sp. SSB1]|uniref:hypothetical protein n=1 Tax=Ensifer sp. SSB1 TaxID=2795385 RepID=UPI001A3E4DFD|nr:hypothetical protein [Ensifer sp. SSB1]MBK5570876.1 hypothetical protein [Ensifer sp. SSB1]